MNGPRIRVHGARAHSSRARPANARTSSRPAQTYNGMSAHPACSEGGVRTLRAHTARTHTHTPLAGAMARTFLFIIWRRRDPRARKQTAPARAETRAHRCAYANKYRAAKACALRPKLMIFLTLFTGALARLMATMTASFACRVCVCIFCARSNGLSHTPYE